MGAATQGGVFYGSNPYGKYGCGYLYAITPQGALTDLYDFPNQPGQGCGPGSSLLDVKGTLCGSTFGGGTNGAGILYSFTP